MSISSTIDPNQFNYKELNDAYLAASNPNHIDAPAAQRILDEEITTFYRKIVPGLSEEKAIRDLNRAINISGFGNSRKRSEDLEDLTWLALSFNEEAHARSFLSGSIDTAKIIRDPFHRATQLTLLINYCSRCSDAVLAWKTFNEAHASAKLIEDPATRCYKLQDLVNYALELDQIQTAKRICSLAYNATNELPECTVRTELCHLLWKSSYTINYVEGKKTGVRDNYTLRDLSKIDRDIIFHEQI